MKTIEKFSSVLGSAAGYRMFGNLIRGRASEIYLNEYVRPASGEKVLDIGCGPADILNHLPKVEYTGFDISPEYIVSAQSRFGSRARFFCGDVGAVSIEGERGSFDLVMATGVVHHLDDEQAAKLFSLARVALRPGGRLITFDGCYYPGQARLARWMLDNDRGKFVRTQEEYVRLASQKFPRIQPYLRHDLLRVPYTHLVMHCSY